jgi:uncharacterized protein YecT (DUF1311 family)
MLKAVFSICALTLCPAALLAKPVARTDYSRFTLTAAASRHMQSPTYIKCLNEAGGVTASMRECLGVEYQRIDARLNASYKRALVRLNESSKARLRRDERSWLKTRLDKCERDLEEDKGGTIWLIEMDDCAVQEHVRRTLWLEQLAS